MSDQKIETAIKNTVSALLDIEGFNAQRMRLQSNGYSVVLQPERAGEGASYVSNVRVYPVPAMDEEGELSKLKGAVSLECYDLSPEQVAAICQIVNGK